MPDTFLMKICIVSSASEAVELRLEVLGERRMVCGLGGLVVVREGVYGRMARLRDREKVER